MLTIDQAYGRREFTARDIALAQGIAEQAAIAIHNASLLESEREEVRFGEALDEAGAFCIRLWTTTPSWPER